MEYQNQKNVPPLYSGGSQIANNATLHPFWKITKRAFFLFAYSFAIFIFILELIDNKPLTFEIQVGFPIIPALITYAVLCCLVSFTWFQIYDTRKVNK